jgi:DNA-binding HxlR family transcriptional regulator
MKIKLSDGELEFLKSTLLSERKDIEPRLKIEFSLTEMDENLADEIRDWAGEKQQLIGFDTEYNLTKEGKLLESIIDKLNH